MTICLIIPAYNEEHSIGETLRDYKQHFPNAIFVVIDNNSQDRTTEVARGFLSAESDYLASELRQGKGHAVRTGLSRVESDIYVMTDGDATYPAEDARKLVDKMLETRADMIVGDRISGGAYAAQNQRRGHSWGNRLVTSIVSRLAGETYNDVLSGLRVMSRPFVEVLDVRSSGFQLETELNVIAAYIRANVIEVPISYREREEGSQSKLNTISDGFRILNFALTNWVAFTPMQPFVALASFTAPFALAFGYRTIFGYLTTGWPYTTTAIAAVATGLFSILSLFFGVALRILVRNDRRGEVARFLEAKRQWNTRLDAAVL